MSWNKTTDMLCLKAYEKSSFCNIKWNCEMVGFAHLFLIKMKGLVGLCYRAMSLQTLLKAARLAKVKSHEKFWLDSIHMTKPTLQTTKINSFECSSNPQLSQPNVLHHVNFIMMQY